MRKILPVFLVGLLLVGPTVVHAATDHVVISEIQVGGAAAADEFVELYNPTLSDVDLTGWRLRVGASTNLVASMSGVIKGQGYILIANPAFTTIPVTPDFVYSASSSSITANSYISLLRKTGTSSFATEDLVGMGTATSFEGVSVGAPAANKSIERLPVEDDTDDNSVDFSLRDNPAPQNSLITTTTPTPTVTPTPTETPTPTPTTAVEPTPTPTVTPTITPTNEPTPTNTPTPTPTIAIPTPTLVPTATAIPTVTPTVLGDQDHKEHKHHKNRERIKFVIKAIYKACRHVAKRYR